LTCRRPSSGRGRPQLTPAELASFFILLVVAGNETTRNAISHALCLLTEHPDQRGLLLADLDARIGPAVEEIVRYVSPVIWMRRTLTQDTVMNGNGYAKGDKVLLFYQAANRDESVFADPDRFDITRSPGIRAAGEPDYLLSSFINGIKHLPCALS
jgi:cytochrome P450